MHPSLCVPLMKICLVTSLGLSPHIDEKLIALEETRLQIESHQMEKEAQQKQEEQEFQMECLEQLNTLYTASRLTI